MHTVVAMNLEQENKQLQKELAKAQTLLFEQQWEMKNMRLQPQKLEEPPTSPTSIVKISSSSVSEGISSSWKNPPSIPTWNMTSSSQDVFLIHAEWACTMLEVRGFKRQ
jgi:hypothetical protein